MGLDEKIKLIRKETGLNRKEFAEYFGIPLRTIEDWEAARRRPPEYVVRLLAYRVQLANLQTNDNRSNVDIIRDAEGNRIVLINDLVFKGRKNVDWNMVEKFLKKYIGENRTIIDTSDIVYIGSEFPDEFCHSKDTKTLRGANLYAKANSSAVINEMIEIATNKIFAENYNKKHRIDAKYGWYRYDTRFALPVYSDSGELVRYNVFAARLLVRHANDGKLYLYDILRIKKETSKPLKQ